MYNDTGLQTMTYKAYTYLLTLLFCSLPLYSNSRVFQSDVRVERVQNCWW